MRLTAVEAVSSINIDNKIGFDIILVLLPIHHVDDGAAKRAEGSKPLPFFFALQSPHFEGAFMDKLVIALLLMCIFSPILH